MESDITISKSTTFYRPILELYKDGKVHRNIDIINEIRNMLPKNERESDKVKGWVERPLQHFRDAGCLERVGKGLHRITEDGEKLLNKNLDSLDRKVLKKYCPKYKEKYNQNSSDVDDENDENDDKVDDEIMNVDITFKDALTIVNKVLVKTGTKIDMDNYDMLLVKQLPDADILKKNKSVQTKGKTAHIALTGDKMDIFPFLESYGYFYNEPGEYDNYSKGRFLLEVPVNLYKSNLNYLNQIYSVENDKKIPTTVTVVRNRKNDKKWSWNKFKNQVDTLEDDSYKRRLKLLGYDVQAELSGTLSGQEFKDLRDLLFKDYFLIILKYKDKFQYDIFAVKPSDGEELKKIDYILFALEKKTVTLVSSNLWSAENNWDDDIKDNGENRLIYGVPGSGKSYTIKDEICADVDESCMERVVFHPDYTYADFVGQILPDVSDDKVKYKFTRGPFTEILVKACSKPWKEFYLIIEEINRGNAPAIFGDIFQLLDRMDEATEEFPIGTSEYPITNSYISAEVYGDESHKIRIPSNLNIIATMNTADQNVFTLDTAFQRRWNMQLIPNEFKDDHKFADKFILKSSVSWKTFVERINNLILKKNTLTTSSEDKRIGVYFIKEEDLDNEKAFAEKVLKYLWDDAFKFSRDKVFIKECNSLEAVIGLFITAEGNERFDIFIDKEFILSKNIDGGTIE